MIGYLLAYLAISLLLLAVLGPVGMSKTYLDKYEADHDRYIQTTKLDTYKRWRQRPELNPPDNNLAARIAFVDEYTARSEFIGEQLRRAIYEFLIDVYKVAMVIILVLRFGRKPLRKLLQGMIENVRKGKEDAWVIGWWLSSKADPKAIFHSDEIGGWNAVRWRNATNDRLLDAGRVEMDPVKAKAIWKEWQQNWLKHTPYTLLYEVSYNHALHKRFTDVEFNAIFTYYNLDSWFPG